MSNYNFEAILERDEEYLRSRPVCKPTTATTATTATAAPILTLKWYECGKKRVIGPRTSALIQCIGLISDIYDAVAEAFKEEYNSDEITEECHDALNECSQKLLDLVRRSIDDATSVDNGII